MRLLIGIMACVLFFPLGVAAEELVIVRTREATPDASRSFEVSLSTAYTSNYLHPLSSRVPERFTEKFFGFHVLKAKNKSEAQRLVKKLSIRSDVQDVYIEPHYEPAVIWTDPSNEPSLSQSSLPLEELVDLRELQDYLFPSPIGVDATFAWTMPGGRGGNVRVVDIEWGWTTKHNELENLISIFGANAAYQDHGTAVMGEMIGKDDEMGITGIVPDAEAIAVSVEGAEYPTVSEYMLFAAMKLSPGDVMLLEMHAEGPNSGGYPQQGYVPMEYFPANFEAIKAITEMGMHVVEAAGNGDEDFDDPVYEDLFDRSVRDSGAIVVGAAAPPRENGYERDHLTRLDFSNHGARVDVMGYGTMVTTTGYGDLFHQWENNFYTAQFGGTSSASPIVAGAVAALSSMVKEKGENISPLEMRDLLKATFTPQRYQGLPGRIGGLPDIKAAWAFRAAPSPRAEILSPSSHPSILPGTTLSFSAKRKEGETYRWIIRRADDEMLVAATQGTSMQYRFQEKGRFIVELHVASGEQKSLAPDVREVVVDEFPQAVELSVEMIDFNGPALPLFSWSDFQNIDSRCFLEFSTTPHFAEEDVIYNYRLYEDEIADGKFLATKGFFPEAQTYFTRFRCRSGLGDASWSNVVSFDIVDEVTGVTISAAEPYKENIVFTDSAWVGTQGYEHRDGVAWVELICLFPVSDFFGEAPPRACMEVDVDVEHYAVKDDVLITSHGLRPLRFFVIPEQATQNTLAPLTTLHLGFSADAMQLSGNLLYVFSKEGVIIVVDVSNPHHPRIHHIHELGQPVFPVSMIAYQDGVLAATSSEIVWVTPENIRSTSVAEPVIGIALVNDRLLLATAIVDAEQRQTGTKLSWWDDGALTSLFETSVAADNMKFIGGRIFLFDYFGFFRMNEALDNIDAVHRTSTALYPRPFEIGDRLIGNSDQSYLEYHED